MNKESGIAKAVKAAGGAAKLAARLGVTRQTVYNWLYAGEVPPGSIIAVYDETGVPVWELAPKLYPKRALK